MNRPDLFTQALRYGSATLHEAFNRQGDLPATIRAAARRIPLAGPALTVSTLPGNNLLIHRALAQAKAGDVLVVAMTELTDGCHEFGYWGDILTAAAIEKGVAGLVIDGCVRDIAAIEAMGFPVYARGTAIRGTTKVAQGEVGGTVRIGHVEIARGDLVVADTDGVVAIPVSSIDEVLELAEQREEKERQIVEKIRSGHTTLELYGFS
ncbi:4-hydroxy-4-methyl-2-oxoglutarate aldolase [Pandoraea terrae]|uniref:Putative 4-hydroxy-4-methyl-2-oxoglutarate aldolase n=1 Tax=Pandoraea terrae TaxID=1537710 RepID=A0A5E4X0A5_9BURK|nr:RraA family protein [Pandoraea terrae]VVE29721.1 4-hydroxy-4-methyl-2-oxoglutarate aldolase [Pandoraea terrae]